MEPVWDRRARWTLLALVAGMLVSLVWLVHPWYEAGDETNDAAIYIACARALAAGEGYSYLGQPFGVRPPGMALLFAPLVELGEARFLAMNLLVSAFGVACVALLFVFARPRLGTALAAAVAAVVWLNDGFRTQCNQAMSDVPGMALVLGCLVLERWARARPSWQRELALGAAIGLATYVRTIAGMLVPAILIARWLASRRAATEPTATRPSWRLQVLPLLVGAALVVLPWSLRNAGLQPSVPVDQNFLHSYSTAMWHVDGGDPASPRRGLAEIAARVPVRAGQLLTTLGSRMGEGEGILAGALGAVLLLALLVVAWRARAPAEIFALIATGIVLLYFGYRPRLALPIWILALVALAELLRVLAARFLAPRAATITVACVLALFPLFDFRPRAGWERIEATHAAYTRQCAAWNAALAPDERVASAVGWHYGVYLERPVYSLFFAIRRGGQAAIAPMLAKYEIDAVLLWPALPADRALVPWFEAQHAPAANAGGAFVFRTRAR